MSNDKVFQVQDSAKVLQMFLRAAKRYDNGKMTGDQLVAMVLVAADEAENYGITLDTCEQMAASYDALTLWES